MIDGVIEGIRVGLIVGRIWGFPVAVGCNDGDEVGSNVGWFDGIKVGTREGNIVGKEIFKGFHFNWRLTKLISIFERSLLNSVFLWFLFSFSSRIAGIFEEGFPFTVANDIVEIMIKLWILQLLREIWNSQIYTHVVYIWHIM